MLGLVFQRAARRGAGMPWKLCEGREGWGSRQRFPPRYRASAKWPPECKSAARSAHLFRTALGVLGSQCGCQESREVPFSRLMCPAPTKARVGHQGLQPRLDCNGAQPAVRVSLPIPGRFPLHVIEKLFVFLKPFLVERLKTVLIRPLTRLLPKIREFVGLDLRQLPVDCVVQRIPVVIPMVNYSLSDVCKLGVC